MNDNKRTAWVATKLKGLILVQLLSLNIACYFSSRVYITKTSWAFFMIPVRGFITQTLVLFLRSFWYCENSRLNICHKTPTYSTRPQSVEITYAHVYSSNTTSMTVGGGKIEFDVMLRFVLCMRSVCIAKWAEFSEPIFKQYLDI